jgi:hypothetical protein
LYLVWDNRILDCKFFGYIITSLSREQVTFRYEKAPDRKEHWGEEPEFLDTSSKGKCIEIIRDIMMDMDDWASEAVLCTIRALLHLGKISEKDLDTLELLEK